jgi:phosphopantothenoylcysteine decarboxylase/phosphopantothenate--cysteine ligase
LMAVYLSAVCPVTVAPAMDEDMWHHPSTKKNLDTITSYGVNVLDVGYGELASGLTGEGRMAEPTEITGAIMDFFSAHHQLKGKKALVTAGPTQESIDPVRFIGNHSTGRMGYAIADELANRGADVTLVSGPVSIKAKNKNIKLLKVMSAREMYEACTMHAADYDIAVMAAAVADYEPEMVADKKIKKSEAGLTIKLKKTMDILASLGSRKTQGQVLVGFALETDNEAEHAQRKLKEKNADLIILNSLNDEGAGFGHETNKVTMFFSNGQRKETALKSKKSLAKDIVDSIIELA